jgi:hypothetical protein
MGACRNSFLVFVSNSRFRALDSQLRKQKHNCYFISTTAISSAQPQKFYVGIVETNGKTANAMSPLQFKCHNCNSNGITVKTKLPKMCHVSSSFTPKKQPAAGPIPPLPIFYFCYFPLPSWHITEVLYFPLPSEQLVHLLAPKIHIFPTRRNDVLCPRNETVQIEIGLSEYGGNKKAIRTDGLLAKHQNWENAKTLFFHHDTLKEGGARLKRQKVWVVTAVVLTTNLVELQYIRVLSTI